MDLAASTRKKTEAMRNAGMTQMRADEFNARIASLGYRICRECTFSYTNSHNDIAYKARSMSYTDIETGLGYAHVNARRDDRFAELQAVRFNSFVVQSGRIWEL